MKKEEKILQDYEIDALAQKLRPHLDRAAENVSPQIAARLAAARQRAVEKVESLASEIASEIASDVISNGTTLALSNGNGRGRFGDWRFWATGLVVASLIAVYGGNEWRESMDARDAAEVELMILGDDVPVDALLDRGFKSFLREENN
jgi:Protein of unknown function (DUF3619)